MDEQMQDDQQEPIFNSSVPIQDIAWKTSRERWMIEMGGERGSGRSVLAARHDDDDDDDDDKYTQIYSIHRWIRFQFLCLMAYQPSLSERRIVVVLFNP